jgi:serine acetyltransferase
MMNAQSQVTIAAGGVSPRRWLKVLVFGAALILVAPLMLAAWLEKRLSSSERVFESLSQLLAMVPALPGTYLRAAYYYATLERCSWETHVGFGSVFTHRGARMGSRASMGVYCVIGHADLGDEVMIGSRVSIPSGKRQHLDDSGRLSCTTRCIVSAGAVVTKEMPGGTLIGGNPARVIRDLDREPAGPAVD